jgi:hypothetical protein
MTPRQFDTAARACNMKLDGRATLAARLVLVEGFTRLAASKHIGVNVRVVARAVDRLQPREKCPTCGKPV